MNAGEVLRACEKMERVEAAEHHHELSVEIAPDLPPVLADRDALRRALYTITENAIKYTPDGGIIRLRVRSAGADRVALEVEDNGPGIHAEDLPHIFESFYRGRATSGNVDELLGQERKIPGVGLGLYLARVLVEVMGGVIEVQSQLGLGSTFTLRLPAWRTAAVKEGDAKSVLIAEAQDWEADSIFVGSRGRHNAYMRFFLGSVSAAVVADATCSVEVVR